MEDSKDRLRILVLLFIAAGVVISLRLFYIQVLNKGFYKEKAISQHLKKFEIPAKRGIIYVHDGPDLVPIAMNQTVKLLFVDPAFIKDKDEVSQKLSEILSMDKAEILALVSKTDSRYEVIKRELSAEEEKKIDELDAPGIVMQSWHKRVYPEDEFMSQVIGFVNRDGEGQYGIEKVFNDELAGEAGLTNSETDANGVPILTLETIVKPSRDGADIVLTIDRNIQSVIEVKLRDMVSGTEAEGGSIVVEEPSTGRILAMASVPSFNPNNFGEVKDYKIFDNPATDSVYEPGSVFKIFSMSTGIETGAITPDRTFNEPGIVRVDEYDIRNFDLKSHGVVTMTQVLEQSLNVGTVWVLGQLGGGAINSKAKQTLYDFYTKFGYGEKTGIELPESAGIINQPTSANHTYAVMTFGQSISVTPLQLTNGVNTIANNGKLLTPHIVDRIKPNDGGAETVIAPEVKRQVVSVKTAAQVGAMMVSVVDRGPVRKSAVNGYSLAGKTGTGQIPLPGGGYDENRTEGSYIGYGPAENPRYTMLVRVRRPKVKHSSSTAAATWGELSAYILNYMQIPPTR